MELRVVIRRVASETGDCRVRRVVVERLAPHGHWVPVDVDQDPVAAHERDLCARALATRIAHPPTGWAAWTAEGPCWVDPYVDGEVWTPLVERPRGGQISPTNDQVDGEGRCRGPEMATKRSTRREAEPRPVGRPVTVGADTPLAMRQPAELVAAMRAAAAAAGIAVSEAWRRACRAWLSLRGVQEHRARGPDFALRTDAETAARAREAAALRRVLDGKPPPLALVRQKERR